MLAYVCFLQNSHIFFKVMVTVTSFVTICGFKVFVNHLVNITHSLSCIRYAHFSTRQSINTLICKRFLMSEKFLSGRQTPYKHINGLTHRWHPPQPVRCKLSQMIGLNTLIHQIDFIKKKFCYNDHLHARLVNGGKYYTSYTCNPNFLSLPGPSGKRILGLWNPETGPVWLSTIQTRNQWRVCLWQQLVDGFQDL